MCVKPETAITVFELLMMSGVSPETYWAIKKHWNNKFYYTVASCWFFLWDLYYNARIHEYHAVILLNKLYRAHLFSRSRRLCYNLCNSGECNCRKVETYHTVSISVDMLSNIFPKSTYFSIWRPFGLHDHRTWLLLIGPRLMFARRVQQCARNWRQRFGMILSLFHRTATSNPLSLVKNCTACEDVTK
jgi:hypothetical protein